MHLVCELVPEHLPYQLGLTVLTVLHYFVETIGFRNQDFVLYLELLCLSEQLFTLLVALLAQLVDLHYLAYEPLRLLIQL